MVKRNLLGLFVNETFLRNESSTNVHRVGLYCLICPLALPRKDTHSLIDLVVLGHISSQIPYMHRPLTPPNTSTTPPAVEDTTSRAVPAAPAVAAAAARACFLALEAASSAAVGVLSADILFRMTQRERLQVSI